MKPVYLNDWKNGGFEAMVADFEGVWDAKELTAEILSSERWRGVEVLIASYGTEDYGGDAFVLFRRHGKLFEVNGGHCSCYGLGRKDFSGDRETQWEPEETTVTELRRRVNVGTLGYDGYHGNKFADELRAALDSLEAEGQK